MLDGYFGALRRRDSLASLLLRHLCCADRNNSSRLFQSVAPERVRFDTVSCSVSTYGSKLSTRSQEKERQLDNRDWRVSGRGSISSAAVNRPDYY